MKFNLESLKSDFLEYLLSTGKIKEEDAKDTVSLGFSIFKYAKEFKDYIQTEMSGKIDLKSMTVADLLTMEIKDKQSEEEAGEGEISPEIPESIEFGANLKAADKTTEAEETGNSENTAESEENGEVTNSEETDETTILGEKENPETINDTTEAEDEENPLVQIFNDLLEDEDFFNAIDKDNSKEISKEEMANFLDLIKNMDENAEDISLEDLLNSAMAISEGKLYDQAKPSESTEETPEQTELPSVEDTPPVSEQPTVQPTTETPTSPTQSPGNNNGDSNSNYNPVNNNTDTPENTKTLSLEELEKQRDEKKTELTSARSDLQTLYSTGRKEVDEAKEKYNEAVKNDENLTDELKEQQKQNIDKTSTTEQEIGTLKSELVDVNSTIKDNESVKTSKESEISAIEASLNSLDPNGPNYSQLKSDLDSKLAKAKSDKKDAGDKIDAANTKKTKIEKEITEKEKELEALKTEKAEIESKISENASQTTKDVFAKYLEAQKTYETNIQNAETKIDSLQNEIKELDEKINKKQAENIKNEHVQTKLNQKYTLNGKEYLSLLSQNKLDNFLANEWANGNYNKNSNCLAMSNLYCKDLIRKLHLPAKNSYDFIDDSREAVEKKAKEMLDKGYPVTLHVSTYRGTRHFETAVGYRINEKGNIEFLCADNVRGVGISTCGEDGSRRHLITGYSTPYSDQNYGYRCLYYC